MKKTLIALAAVAATGAVFAQSSVTLFGVVDLGITNLKTGNAKAVTSMTNGNTSSSRLGFRGVEDLGGGMSVGFWLEGGLSPDTGGTALNFQRRSTISLMGGFGEVRLGRDYTPTFWNHNSYSPFGVIGIGSSVTNFLTGASALSATIVRSDNTISYFTPKTLGGFFAEVQYGFKEVPTGSSASDYAGIRVGYAAGPLSVAIATAQEGCNAAGTNCGIDNPTRTNIGASYDLGFVKPMFQYAVIDQDTQGQLTNMAFGVTAPLGPVLLKGSYVITNAENAAGTDLGDAKQFVIGADYVLSKRTALYGTYARTSVDAGSPFTKKRGYEVGVRHSF